MTAAAAADTAGTDNNKDPAEPYRLYDGFGDDGVDEEGVMTLEVGRERGAIYVFMEGAFMECASNVPFFLPYPTVTHSN